MKNIATNKEYQNLIGTISQTYENGRSRALNAVNTELVKTYYEIGKYIVEFEQGGDTKASYGKGLLEQLSRDLTLQYGKGFSRSNLFQIRLFYLKFPKIQTVSGKLSWSHIVELLKISDEMEREFYEKQTVLENWSVRELQRQKESGLFLRLSAGENKQGIIEHPADILSKEKDELLVEYAT